LQMSPRGYWLNEFETKCEDTGRESARQAGAIHTLRFGNLLRKVFRPSDMRAGMAGWWPKF